MGIFDVFTTTPKAVETPAAAPTTPPNPGAIPNPDPAAVQADPNVAAPNGVVPPADKAKLDDPLDKFDKLWDTIPKPEGADEPTTIVELNADEVAKAVGKANFANNITPEIMDKISAGGPEAAVAFQEALNSSLQNVMAQTILASNKISNQSVTQAVQSQADNIPSLIQTQQDRNHIKSANPIFDKPAVKPVMEAVQSKLREKFPEATAEQVTEWTQDYIVAMGQEITGPAEPDPGEGGQDWNVFLNGP